MLRIICFFLILCGGILMTLATIRYQRLLRDADEYLMNMPPHVRVIKKISLSILVFFVGGYAVGGIHVLTGEVDPIFYFVGIVFFSASLFAYFLIYSLSKLERELSDKNRQLQTAYERIESHNKALRAEVDSRVQEVIWQDKLLHTVNEAASILLASSVEDFDDALLHCMGMLARCVEVDRVYIWKNHRKDGRLFCTQVCEWSETAEPQQGTDITIDIAYDENMPGWEEALSSGKSVNGLVKDLSPEEQNQLSPQGIISILVVPVFLQDEFWGFVGFDDCHKERAFPEAEEGILRSASLLIATSMLRNDITNNLVEAREAALLSTKAKGDFLSNMSHEIRTPINAITGMATLARKTDNIREVHHCLDRIDAASRQLLGIINDILDMSKIEAGKMELASEVFDLHTAFYNVKSIIGVRAAERKQVFSLTIEPGVPSIVVGDEMRLSQILINLLSNAVKFTDEGGNIGLSVQPLRQVEDKCELEINVRDDGIGLSEEQQKRLFQAFEQAEKNTARRFGGTGLGLAISKRIAELMNGDITVESRPRKGSCFTVRLWLQMGTYAALRKTVKDQQLAELDFTGFTALLAEDIEINREIAIALLEEKGMEVDWAENGQQALERFQQNPDRYHIIFMDIQMPVMDGYEATERIRGLDIAAAADIPIIAMTANAFDDDVSRCKSAGMNDHIAKPIEIDKLYRIINQYLWGRYS